MPDQTDRALKAVLECRDTLEALNQTWGAQGLPELPTRFGLATGPVVVGNMGAPTRLAYTVLGDTVNLASRLEGLNKVYGTSILVDIGTQQAGGDAFAMRHLDRIIVVGKTQARGRAAGGAAAWATDIFELLGETGKVPAVKLAAARRYEAAWDKYRSGEFHQAFDALAGFEAEFGPDPAVERLRQMCQDYQQAPTGSGLGRNLQNVDQMRRRQRQRRRPAGRKGGHGKNHAPR